MLNTIFTLSDKSVIHNKYTWHFLKIHNFKNTISNLVERNPNHKNLRRNVENTNYEDIVKQSIPYKKTIIKKLKTEKPRR